MTKYIYLYGIILLTTAGCFSPSDEIRKSFDVVVKSLDKSNEYQSRKLAGLYDTISKYRTNNKEFATKADTIYLQTNLIIENIEVIRTELSSKDSSGDNLNNSTRLLVNTETGNGLYRQLKQFYETAKDNSIDENLTKQIDSLSIDYPEKLSMNKWLEFNFKTVPTIGATTLLSKYQNDCLATGELILKEIKNEIKK